jgi:DNA-binding MarR family transcriptional regulator
MGDFRKNAISKFREIFRSVDIQYSNFVKTLGVNFTSICILECLCDSDTLITQKELCKKLALPKQMVNTVIKSFWEQGFVELKEAKDRRHKVIILTDSGKEYPAKVIKPLQSVDYAAWSCFTNEEMETLIEFVGRYEKSFEQTVNEYIASEK